MYFIKHKNDRCEDARDLGPYGDGQDVILRDQSSIGATDDSTDCHFGGVTIRRGVWYKLGIAFPAELSVSTCYSSFGAQVAVFFGACGSLVCADRLRDFNGCDMTTRVIDNITSQNIYILVGGLSETTGSFALTVSVSALNRSPLPVSWLVTKSARKNDVSRF